MKTDDIEEILTRGVGAFIDPEGVFKDKLLKKAKGEYKDDIVIKFGVDPTRPDIHLGHAVALRKLRQFQELGCKVIFLAGDFTAQIGDPTGKSKIRPEISQQEIKENMQTYLDQVGKILKTEEKVFSWIANSDWFVNITDVAVPSDFKVETFIKQQDNSERAHLEDHNSLLTKTIYYDSTRLQKSHLKKNSIQISSLLNFLSVLRNITHSQLIARDLFKNRINSGEELYMHEMMYPVLQGMDSSILSNIYGSCDLEMGGTDQTFNMLMGRDVMKMSKQPEQAVLAVDILPGTDGSEKMSKSLDNYIGITDTPNDMFGKVMSLNDEVMPTYFTLATYTPTAEIEEIKTKLANDKLHPKDTKIRLAREIVTIYHGEAAAKLAEENFTETFSKKGLPTDLFTIKKEKGTKIVDIVLETGMVESKAEWKRLVDEGAVTNSEDGRKIDAAETLEETLTIKIGKRRFIKIETI
jgi:tyrosyl-tRNA synthetase